MFYSTTRLCAWNLSSSNRSCVGRVFFSGENIFLSRMQYFRICQFVGFEHLFRFFSEDWNIPKRRQEVLVWSVIDEKPIVHHARCLNDKAHDLV